MTLPAITSKAFPTTTAKEPPLGWGWGGLGAGMGALRLFPASRARESRSQVLRRGSGGEAGEAPQEGWQRRVLPH